MVVTYVIPVAAMGVSYSLMSHVLWRAKGIGELNQRQAESIQSKRKVSQFLFFLLRLLLFIHSVVGNLSIIVVLTTGGNLL